MVSNDRSSRQIVRISLAAVKQREIGTTVIIGLCVLLIHSLAYTDTHVDPVSGKVKPSDKVWESADVLASFKSVAWKHFGFPVLGNEKEEKVTNGEKNYIHTHYRTITNTHLEHFLAHVDV